METIQHLQGMNDLSEAAWLRFRTVKERFREFLSLYGYRMLETPILEPTELFLRKGGGELATRMYAFTDQGGNRISLRPEYTASVVRHYLEHQEELPLPLRYQYAGPVFRYQGGQSLRQFTQVGAELIGSSSPLADAEVLELAVLALSNLGLSGHGLVLGDVGLYTTILSTMGLSERAKAFILSNVSLLGTGAEGRAAVRERAIQSHLLGNERLKEQMRLAAEGLEQAKAQELLSQLLQRVEGAPLGQRDPRAIVERVMRKLRGTDEPARVEKALEVAYRLAQVKGKPGPALSQAHAVMQEERLDPSALARLERVVALLDRRDLASVPLTVDLSLAREIAYYTGVVFEVEHLSTRTSLGGGGRYDTLVKTLGGRRDVPALGFAFTVERLAELMTAVEQGHHQHRPAGVLLVSANGQSLEVARELASSLRKEGRSVEVDLMGRGLEEALDYARSRGLGEVALVAEDGKVSFHPVGSL